MPRKVLFINPNLMKPVVTPVAIDYLAQTLEEKGFIPEVLDLAFAPHPQEELARSCRNGEYLFIALTIRNLDDSYFPSQDFCLLRTKLLIDQIRSLTESPLVLGGVGFSIQPEGALSYCGVEIGIQASDPAVRGADHGDGPLDHLGHAAKGGSADGVAVHAGPVLGSGLSGTHRVLVQPAAPQVRVRALDDAE